MSDREAELIDCAAGLVPSLRELRPHEVLRVLSSALVQTTRWPEADWLAMHDKVAPYVEALLDAGQVSNFSDAPMIVGAAYLLDAIALSMQKFEAESP